MKEINFYCIEEEVNNFLYIFLSKLLKKNKKVTIYSESIEKMTKLDEMLWNMKKVDFLPHLLINEPGAEKTPLLISNEKQNKNNSDYLLVSSFLEDYEYINKFEKMFYIFSPISPNLIINTKENWNKYKEKDYVLKLLRKDKDGKWIENLEFNIYS